ncbi:glycine zipper 2TM domain-containing protein [Noviherbaspirillum denitrificans]|uniref:Osmotically inducible lipoprotein OsmB n=1 Tax=Noviherbaspirillum denitrificans TaxID=1968433 RepID=A0A254TA95_9BURK|nr:glycine zipper 2TM domain-containing protein [Noviherbaspirillum denitrificans]OWW19569.1 osmotically inducible lipoprotein OsmB [Noviherbaspirillum denitrificans]
MLSRRLISIAGAFSLALTITACGTTTRQQVGIGTGAVLGGVAGSAVTNGSTLGTVGGAAVGGVIGNEVAKKKK